MCVTRSTCSAAANVVVVSPRFAYPTAHMHLELRNHHRRHSFAAAIVVAILLVFTQASAREKTDVVMMGDGAVLYGETKGMTLGKLKLSTNYLGTVMVEWEHVEHMESAYKFEVELEDGKKYLGTIEKTSTPRQLVIVWGAGRITLNMSEVVHITPIKRTVLARIDGYLNLGFSYAKSSEVLQLTLDWSATYRSPKNLLEWSADVTLNKTAGQTTTQRQEYDLVYQRQLSGKWFGEGGVGLQQNQELGVDLRQLIFGTTGFHLRQTNHDVLSASAGLDVNNEMGTDSDTYQQSLESLVSLAYSLFQYDDPTTNVSLTFIVYPSLTESGRIRSNVSASVGREIVHNLNVALSGYYSSDNEPPTPGAATTDWGTVLSAGWSY